MHSEPMLLGDNFYRRRKLRIQQVREQSKDIARKIRERTEMEKVKNIMNLDARKEKLYLERQERIVEELEKQHALGLKKIGASHSDAVNLKNDEQIDVVDLSKSRGRVAARVLRETKQKALDEKKKVLDRKLQARETANELSREKNVIVANKIKTQEKLPREKLPSQEKWMPQERQREANREEMHMVESEILNVDEDKSTAHMAIQCDSHEFQKESDIVVPIVLEENEALAKEPTTSSCLIESTDAKKPNLFALSDEMPSSLRGSVRDTTILETPDLFKPSNVISEYVQNRGLRLRQPIVAKSSTDNLHKIKETIIKTRAAHGGRSDRDLPPTRQKSNQVPIYDHSTRDTQNINYNDKLVDRDEHIAEDAYCQAMKEATTMSPGGARNCNRVLNEQRHKVATTKQKIQKEYEDTLAFLKMLPKQKDNRPLRQAYMADCRQKQQKDIHQKKMEHEYKKIEKECRRRCMNSKHSTKSPVATLDDESECVRLSGDNHYAWIPVPESDRSLAIHKIPNNKKTLQSVTFDDNCSYHEYRSRHKHTPPTKERISNKTILEESEDKLSASEENSSNDIVVEENNKESGAISDKNRIIIYKIIDSHLDLKDVAQKSKMENGVVTSLTTLDKELRKGLHEEKNVDKSNTHDKERRAKSNPVEELTEGVYRVVKEKDSRDSSIMKCHISKVEMELWETMPSKYWWDNIAQVNPEDETRVPKQTGDQIIICKCGNAREKCAKDGGGSVDLKNSGAGDSQVKSIDSASSGCSKCASTTQEQLLNNLLLGSSVSTASYRTVESNIRKQLKEPDSNSNFYIGASGFLKDEDYEVVIQLRKKEPAQNKSERDDKVSNTCASQSSLQKSDESKLTQIKEEQEQVVQEPTKVDEAIIDMLSKEDVEEPDAVISKNRSKSPTNIFLNSKAIEVNIEKAVVPEPTDKPTDNKQKVTSICTQTSFSTPMQQFYHQVNSSTSTSYMSPPEIILPKSLKNSETQRDFVPDGFISHTDEMPRDEFDKKERENNKKICKKSKTKSHRCKKHLKNLTSKRYFTKRKGDGDSNIYTAFHWNTKRSCNSALNSVLKEYVDKVLKLKDGAKMYEVATQYCSSVTTPGSSVINMSSNIESTPNYLEELRKKISSEIFKKLNLDIDNVRANRNSQQTDNKKSKKPIRRKLQRKHKIKSRNFSRKLNKEFRSNNGISSAHSTSTTSCIENKQQKQDEICSNASRPKSTKHNNSIISSDEVNSKIQKENQDDLRSNISRSKSSRRNINVLSSASDVNSKIQMEKQDDILCPNICHSKSSKHNSIISSADEVNSKLLKEICSKSSKHDILLPRADEASCQILKEKQDEVCSNGSRSKSTKHSNSVSSMDKANSKASLPKSSTAKSSVISIGEGFSKSKTDSKISRTKESKCKNKGAGNSKSLPSASSIQLNDEQNNPINTSTQTNDEQVLSADAIMMQLEKDKLQNMEKIAILTQKCTERLSHLTRVLEEVRKKKPEYLSTTDTSSENEKLVQFSPKEVLQKETHLISESTSDPLYKKRKIVLDKEVIILPHETREEATLIRGRCKPPPVLSRANIKLPEHNVIPHELSTVPEADSPSSFKLRKSLSPSNTSKVINEELNLPSQEKIEKALPNKIPSKLNTSKQKDTSMERPIKMLDLSQYNELMLKPFVTIADYARQCNMGTLDEGSNLDDIPKGEVGNDDISSVHSDASLPDVVSELLKQNIAYEPFKFESMSHVNSTTISSDSSVSMLLSKKKYHFDNMNKIKLNDTSDSLSISSNPDLESSFKKMGMAWASSTLKKTKERLALSSSTTTSTSNSVRGSMKRPEKTFKSSTVNPDHIKATDKNLLTDTDMSRIDGSKPETSMAMSKMVKEYLTNELAKKIIFSNESDMHYTSLYSTKFPAESLDVTSDEVAEINKSDLQAGRQRTSTPVHLYKSVNYNTISSNSNIDDLSSVKVTSSSLRNNSNSDKDELSIPNYSLKLKRDNK